jgi:hypothetical protein
MRNARGISLIETVLTLGMLSIIIVVIAQQSSIWQKWTSRTDKIHVLVDVMTANVTEIKIKDFANLPAGGTCLTRHYDLRGVFVSEASAAMGGTQCPYPAGSNEIVVVWSVPRYADLNISFVPAAALVLPSYTEALKEISIRGTTFGTSIIDLGKSLELTMYKR